MRFRFCERDYVVLSKEKSQARDQSRSNEIYEIETEMSKKKLASKGN